jgi:rhodanese-related sulfurtransferase
MLVPQISLEEAWELLEDDPESVLIDVRTVPEWTFVGVPDLSSIGKEVRTVEWSRFPTGELNPDFVAHASAGLDRSQTLLMLCRSGARSNSAAAALAEHGYTTVNIGIGFEGDLGPGGHRHGGWKQRLPWRQS